MIPAVSAAGAGAAVAPLPYQWVLVGTAGELYTSTSTSLANGSWTSRTSSFGSTNLSWVASNGTSLYVATGDTGKLATSPDGVTWTQRTSSFGTDNISMVAYGDGYWVAVGANTKVAYSTDGVTWTQNTTGITGAVGNVAWGNGTWIVAGAGGLYTATNPTGTWTSRTSTITSVARTLYFKGQSIWVAGADTGTTGALASSTDAITWTARNSPTSFFSASSVFVANTTVVADMFTSASSTVDIISSTNGTTWTDRTPAWTSAIIYFGASDDAGLLAYGASAQIQTSTDGTTWTSKTGPTGNSIALCHSSGMPSNR